MKILTVDKQNFPQRVSIYLLVYLPLSPIIEHYFSVKILGYSFWNTVFPFIAISLVFILKLKWANIRELISFYLFFLSIVFVATIRVAIYGDNAFEYIIRGWYLFILPMFIYLVRDLNFNTHNERIIKQIIFVQLFFLSLTGLLYILVLPTLNFITADHIIGGRFGGVFTGSNVYSNFLAISYIILSLSDSHNLKRIFIYTITVIPGLIAAVSRGPTLLVIATLIIVLLINVKKRLITLIIFSGSLIIIFNKIILKGLNFQDLFNRIALLFSQGDPLRTYKTELGFNMFFSSLKTFLFGNSYVQINSGIIKISDNSLILILTSWGGIVFIFWLSTLIIFSKVHLGKVPITALIYLLFIVAVLLTNNAVLYIAWSFYVSMGFYLIFKRTVRINN